MSEQIPVVEIVSIAPRRVWAEKDFFGTVHIKMQHEGCEAFDFIKIQYDYRYTSNSHQLEMLNGILALLGEPPINERLRVQRPTLETVTAQHDETGRMWEGPRDQLPPRYSVVNTSPEQCDHREIDTCVPHITKCRKCGREFELV